MNSRCSFTSLALNGSLASYSGNSASAAAFHVALSASDGGAPHTIPPAFISATAAPTLIVDSLACALPCQTLQVSTMALMSSGRAFHLSMFTTSGETWLAVTATG